MNRMMRNFTLHVAYAFVATVMVFTGVAGLPQSALAQEGLTLEEVIVTAQRREESLQDVPLAVTVLTGAEMERRQVQNLMDLTSSVPNITIAQNTGTPSAPRVFLRGVGEDESRATVEPAISLYIDGVYIGRQIGALVELFDVEQVEVLRGPQGTLYGRNSNGGAIRITTRKPTYDETFLTLKNTLGNENRIDAQLSANLSNSPDLAVSFSVLTRTRDGLFRTTEGGGRGVKEVGGWDNLSGRLGVRWQAGEDTEMLVRYDATVDNTDPRPPNLHSVDDDDAFKLASGNNANTDRYDSEVNSRGVGLTVDHDLGDGLTMQSLTAWRSLKDELHSVIGVNYDQKTDQSQVSQEFQVSSDWDGGFNFVAGMFWFDEDIGLDYTFFGNYNLEVETRAWAVFGQGSWDIIREQMWVTAGVRYTDEEKDFKGNRGVITGPFAGFFGVGPFESIENESWENVSFKLALNYQLRDNLMFYGSYSTGFKSGAWSPDALDFADRDNFRPVDDEKVETAEIGIRSDWLDNRLRVNATYFFSTYENLQLSGTLTGFAFTRFNVPEAEISGLEIEAAATPLPGLDVSLAISWLDAEYTDVDLSAALGITGRSLGSEVNTDVVAQVDKDRMDNPGSTAFTDNAIVQQALNNDMMIPRTATLDYLEANAASAVTAAKLSLGNAAELDTAPRARISADIINDAENNDLKNAPESSIKLSVSYTYPLADNMDLEISGSYLYEDESFNLVANPENLKREETDLINLRVGVRSDQWEVFLWGKNITDEIYHPAGTTGGGGQVYVADPRMYGLDFKLNFGK